MISHTSWSDMMILVVQGTAGIESSMGLGLLMRCPTNGSPTKVWQPNPDQPPDHALPRLTHVSVGTVVAGSIRCLRGINTTFGVIAQL
jgi:hypothetical protein